LKDVVCRTGAGLGDYRLHIRFEGGVENALNLAPDLSILGAVEPLRDPACFARVRVDPELGTWLGRTEPTSIPTSSADASPAPRPDRAPGTLGPHHDATIDAEHRAGDE
jgi:hypothetical protein